MGAPTLLLVLGTTFLVMVSIDSQFVRRIHPHSPHCSPTWYGAIHPACITATGRLRPPLAAGGVGGGSSISILPTCPISCCRTQCPRDSACKRNFPVCRSLTPGLQADEGEVCYEAKEAACADCNPPTECPFECDKSGGGGSSRICNYVKPPPKLPDCPAYCIKGQCPSQAFDCGPVDPHCHLEEHEYRDLDEEDGGAGNDAGDNQNTHGDRDEDTRENVDKNYGGSGSNEVESTVGGNTTDKSQGRRGRPERQEGAPTTPTPVTAKPCIDTTSNSECDPTKCNVRKEFRKVPKCDAMAGRVCPLDPDEESMLFFSRVPSNRYLLDTGRQRGSFLPPRPGFYN